MQFYQKRKTATAIPIVPMIDILTILLIFFVIHTQWKKTQYVLKIDVPSTEYIQGTEMKESGDVLAVSADSRITLNGVLVALEDLPAVLAEYKREHPQTRLQQDIDKGVSVEMLVKIIDALTSAGIDVPEVPIRIAPKSPAAGNARIQ